MFPTCGISAATVSVTMMHFVLGLAAIACAAVELPSAKSPTAGFAGALQLENGQLFTPAQYQDFVDYFPVSRFNNFGNFSRRTREAGVHRFPKSPARRLPHLIDQFDWALMPNEFTHMKGSDPKTIWAWPSSQTVNMLLDTAERNFSKATSDRVLVFGNHDLWLSEVFGRIGKNPFDQAYVEGTRAILDVNVTAVEAYRRQREVVRPRIEAVVARLSKYFGRIFYEAKDMDVAGVRTMPIGLTEFFLRNGVAEAAAAAIAGARLDRKPGWVKGAFSFYHDLARCPRGWGEGQLLRKEAREWSKSAHARQLGVNASHVEPLQWWGEIARYRFLMAPNGCGVQTPKQVEALAVLTVPIVKRWPYPAYDDLVRYGFPLAVVDDWSEITTQRLSDWWEERAPRLESFRSNCLTSAGYWRLFTGQVERCE